VRLVCLMKSLRSAYSHTLTVAAFFFTTYPLFNVLIFLGQRHLPTTCPTPSFLAPPSFDGSERPLNWIHKKIKYLYINTCIFINGTVCCESQCTCLRCYRLTLMCKPSSWFHSVISSSFHFSAYKHHSLHHSFIPLRSLHSYQSTRQIT
jgi:hypothetical protein